MAGVVQSLPRPRVVPSARAWVRENLFSSWYNGLLTLLTAVFLYVVLRGVVGWAFADADWRPVTSNLKLLAVGQYPPQQLWRVALALLVVSFLSGMSGGGSSGVVRNFALALGGGLLAMAALPLDLETLGLGARLWLVGSAALLGIGFWVARGRRISRRALLLGWLLSFGLTLLLLRGLEGVSSLPAVKTDLVGGLLLTFLLALVGIVASFPLGVLLALGRRSSLPVISIFSTLFIELVRGVPLVTILFMASIIFPLFLPGGIRVDRVLRALMGIILFSAAYMAENVRGGLQAIPEGQVEAAKALGLSGLHITLLIVLPQALRAVIPAIVGQFISLFKDTTLVVIVGLTELLGIGKSILQSDVAFIGRQAEVYLFIAAIFWVFTYSMSYASRRLERALGVGER